MWFGLAAIALLGAVALLYIDRSRRDQVGRVRQMWAKAQGYTYEASDDDIVLQFRRAALAKPEQTTAVDLVSGVRRGEKFVLFDVEETSTIVAVQRPVGSDVDIDLRLKSTPPPRESDMELLGSIGPRVVFATNVEVARRVCDQRMAAFTESVPAGLNLLWSENDWTLGSLPLGSTGRDWDAAIDAVARLSGMLHVLPPVNNRRPSGPARTSPPQRSRPETTVGRQSPEPRQNPEARQSPVPRQSPAPRQSSEPRRSPEPRQNPEPRQARPEVRRPEPRPPLRSGPVIQPSGPRPPSRPTPITRDSDRRRQD
ncbi:hypothetical protein [Rhodococcoides fascians]|uniref:hypothetical protein n=1 Tax=Rhodococcoides fascians TaxID=1828 RepID=UPI00055B2DC6|nr:hypothetical protein [Rhodococcus fascians]